MVGPFGGATAAAALAAVMAHPAHQGEPIALAVNSAGRVMQPEAVEGSHRTTVDVDGGLLQS